MQILEKKYALDLEGLYSTTNYIYIDTKYNNIYYKYIHVLNKSPLAPPPHAHIKKIKYHTHCH